MRTGNLAQQRYLRARADRLKTHPDQPAPRRVMRPTSTRIRPPEADQGGDHVHLALRRPRRECAADVAVPRARCLATSMS